jgi:hypothetical protein
MTDERNFHSRGSSGGEHPLDGIRFALPVPEGAHHADIVASFARWLGKKHDLEPFDLQVSECAGKLSFRPLTPARKLELCRVRSHDAMRRACMLGTASTTLMTTAASIRNRTRTLIRHGHEQQETMHALRASAAELRGDRGTASRPPSPWPEPTNPFGP